MTKIFTKADIEIEHFEEEVSYNSYSDDQHVSKLYERIEELKSQDIYVVDVTLVSTHTAIKSLSLVFNQYMIRFVRPKYEVSLEIEYYVMSSNDHYFSKSESIGFFKTTEEVEEIKKEYAAKNNDKVHYTVNVLLHSPLDEAL